MTETLIQNVMFDERGLIPAIVQDAGTGEIITLCYLDNASLVETLSTGKTSFLAARTSQAQERRSYKLLDIRLADEGSLLTVLIERGEGEAAEDKTFSLMDGPRDARRASKEVSLIDADSLELGITINELYALIAERKEKRPEGSYTSYLFNSGLDKILKKIAEESGEVIIAAKNKAPREIISELADLFYHLIVLMVERDVKLRDVHGELTRRAAKASQSDRG